MSAFQFQMPSFGMGRRGRLTDVARPTVGNFGPRPEQQDYFQQLAPLVAPEAGPARSMPTWAERTASFAYQPGQQINSGNAIQAAQYLNAQDRAAGRFRQASAGGLGMASQGRTAQGAQQQPQQMMPTFDGGQMAAYAPQMGGGYNPVPQGGGYRPTVNPMDYSAGRTGGGNMAPRGPAQMPPTGGPMMPAGGRQARPSQSFGQFGSPSSMYGTSSRSRGYR